MLDNLALGVHAGDVIVEHQEHGLLHYTAHRTFHCADLRLLEQRAALRPIDLAPAHP